MAIKLQESEQVLFEGKPEPKLFFVWIFTKVIPACFIATFFIIWCTLFFGGLFACAMRGAKEANYFPFFILIRAAFILPIIFGAAYFYYRALLKTFHYAVTNQRCIFEGGIMIRRLRSVPFYKITDLEINQNIVERMLGIYSLKIFTAGTASLGAPGLEKAEIVFFGLTDAETPSGIIQNILKKYKATGE